MSDSPVQPIIELENVDKFFGDFQALKDITSKAKEIKED